MRILIITLLNIGDVLFTTPAMRSVREAYPDAEIDVLVKRLAVDTVEHNPIFTNVFSFDTRTAGRSPGAFLALMGQLRSRRYDLLISLHSCARVTLITAFSGARRKVGLVSRKFEWVLDTAACQKTGMHMVNSYLEVLRDVGIPPLEDAAMEMHVDEASQSSADEMWQSEGLDSATTVIGINHGSRAPARMWLARNWAELTDRLNRSGAQSVIFGGPADVETAEAICSRMETQSPMFTGRLTLLQLAAMARKCSVFVSSDTGPMHIAASQRTPVVAIFGPTPPALYAPYGTRSVVLKSENPCPGCQDASADPAEHTCLTDITVEEVYAGIQRLLADAKP